MDQVAERLAELRERRALTLRELGEISGVAADTINQIELGHRKARPSTLRKLARALEIDVQEFYGQPTHPKAGAPSSSGQPEKRRSKIELRPTGTGPEVTREALEEHGIPVTDAELRTLNIYLEGLQEAREAGEPSVIISLAGDSVDHQRIELLATYVLTTPGMLAPEKVEAVRRGVHDALVAF